MKKLGCRAIIVATIMTGAAVSTALAGDMYWSPVPGLTDVKDFAVCGTTVYAATTTGLFRSQGDPESWEQVRSNGATLVACWGQRVIWEEIIGIDSVVYVSHDGLQSVVAANGLDDSIISGLRDLAIAGNTALVATLWGVDRSTDGGLNFPSAYPVLWHSSAGYQITAVWTNGTACAAAGSGGFADAGVWYSATGVKDTWNLVLDIGGMEWLNGDGSSNTLVAGDLYGGVVDGGYISTDAGATWMQLPLSWSGPVTGHYQRPFVSDGRILSRHVYEVFDPDSGQFITYTNGPYIYDTDSGVGNDMDASLSSEAELLNQAIVETIDPYLLVAERAGAVYWFRVPGGWPAGGFDFTPPFSPSLDVSPRLTLAPLTAADLHPSAFDAATMYVQELNAVLTVTHDVNGFHTTLIESPGPTTGGWVPYTTSLPWSPDASNGLHVFFAWYADANGNITDPSVAAGVTVVPETLSLGENGAWGTYLYARAGESFTIGATSASGDIDVHHWEPGSTMSDDWAATWSNDTLSFTADATGYHLVCLLNYAGSGAFSGSLTAQTGLKDVGLRVPNDKPAEVSSGDAPAEEPPSYYSIIAEFIIFADGFESGDLAAWSSSTP